MAGRDQLDGVDLKILSELQQDGRIRNNELALRVGVSAPNCLRRLKSLFSRGVIRAVRAVIDERRLGYEVVSFVSIQLGSQAQPVLEAFEKLDRRDPAHPAVLADFGRHRLSPEMRGAERREHAPAASALRGDAGREERPQLSSAGCRQGCAVAVAGRRDSVCRLAGHADGGLHLNQLRWIWRRSSVRRR